MRPVPVLPSSRAARNLLEVVSRFGYKLRPSGECPQTIPWLETSDLVSAGRAFLSQRDPAYRDNLSSQSNVHNCPLTKSSNREKKTGLFTILLAKKEGYRQ